MKKLYPLLALLFCVPAMAAVTISGGGLLSLLITIIVVGLVCYLLWWLIGYIALPAPFDKIARVIIALVAVIFLLNLVLGLTGNSFFVIK